MTKPITALAACLALAGGVAAGCGGDDEESASTTPATTAGPAQTTEAPADVVMVDMKDIKYVPRNVTANVGQTVRWTNSDPVAHTVTAKSGSDVDSGTINPNDTFEAKFDKPGKVDYVCTIHPNQTGTVTVR
jgi:plastocyanin